MLDHLFILDGAHNPATLTIHAIIDTASSVIWRSVFFGVGDFEIYAPATKENIEWLQVDNFVMRPDTREVGIIERIEIADDAQNGAMVTATGRLAKSILSRRMVFQFADAYNKYTPVIIGGTVENAARHLVSTNAINCAFDDRRNFPFLSLGAVANIPHIIVDDNGDAAVLQVPIEELLTYTDELLKQYGMASKVIYDEGSGKLQYVVYEGMISSVSSGTSYPIVFSKEFDNLASSTYKCDKAIIKSFALIAGEGDIATRPYFTASFSRHGLHRREIFVDASSIGRTYRDENDEEKTYTYAEYRQMCFAEGSKHLVPYGAESFDGVLDLNNCQWKYNTDFSLGDIVTIQNNDIGKMADARIVEVLEVQDENGYSIEAIAETYTEDDPYD